MERLPRITGRAAEAQDVDARGIVVLVSPRAGYASAAKRLGPIRLLLEEHGYSVEVTENVEELMVAARRLRESGQLRAVLSAGGDGTARLAAQVSPAGSPILPLPMGTENLLPKYLRQTTVAADVLKTLTEGVLVDIDRGRAGSDSFLLMVSIGFDAHVVRGVHEGRRGHISKLNYYRNIVAALMSYDFPRIRYRAYDGETLLGEGECRWLFAMNLPCYAQQIGILPQAVGSDGKIDLCALRDGSILAGLGYFADILRHRHQDREDVTILRGDRFQLEQVESELPIQMDGDCAGTLPLELTIESKAVRLLVRPDEVTRLGFVPVFEGE